MLRALKRLLLGSVALALAIPLGCAVLGTGLILDPSLRGMVVALIRAGLVTGFWDVVHTLSPQIVLDTIVALAKSLLLLVTVPPLLTGVVGETLRFRALSWYAGACGLMTAGLPWIARSGFRLPSGETARTIDARATALLLLAGSAAGFAYWLVAGWSAGRAHDARPTAPRQVQHPGHTLSLPESQRQ